MTGGGFRIRPDDVRSGATAFDVAADMLDDAALTLSTGLADRSPC